MPRKRSDENLTKVVSSVVSIEDFEILEKCAREYYTKNLLKQPTISHVVRFILSNWTKQIKKIEQQPIRNRKLNQPGPDNHTEEIDPEIFNFVLRRRKT